MVPVRITWNGFPLGYLNLNKPPFACQRRFHKLEISTSEDAVDSRNSAWPEYTSMPEFPKKKILEVMQDFWYPQYSTVGISTGVVE